MSVSSLHEIAIMRAQMRAIKFQMGGPFKALPIQSAVAALCKHGGVSTMLDPGLMAARLAAFQPPPANGAPPMLSADELAKKLQTLASSFFYRLVDDKPGYIIHTDLMAYLTEPGRGNGVVYDEDINQPSERVPAAFTFVGQFIDHDLTFNPMNLTADQNGAVSNVASPLIDLDSMYGPRQIPNQVEFDLEQVFDEHGCFRLKQWPLPDGQAYEDLCRDENPDSRTFGMGLIVDPRNDENQLILQIHLLLQRLHNKLIREKLLVPDPGHEDLTQRDQLLRFVNKVRREVVSTWQSFVLNEYLPAVLDPSVLSFVLTEIHKQATDPAQPKAQYGALKHKPLRNLTNNRNVVRMPHEFAIGFRFGHSQLRPIYVLNKQNVVLLFKDARHSDKVEITFAGQPASVKVDGRDDLRGSRKLEAGHVLDWAVFYPTTADEHTMSMRIDQQVTARVFNLPESAIPDDIKYIGNLPHRNLIRSSQLGVVSGEELAEFYGYTALTPADIVGAAEAARPAAQAVFMHQQYPNEQVSFKTPLWYYLLKEADCQQNGRQLGQTGSRLVGEVLAGALYYGNPDEFPYNDDWLPQPKGVKPTGTPVYQPNGPGTAPNNAMRLRDIIDFVQQKDGARKGE